MKKLVKNCQLCSKYLYSGTSCSNNALPVQADFEHCPCVWRQESCKTEHSYSPATSSSTDNLSFPFIFSISSSLNLYHEPLYRTQHQTAIITNEQNLWNKKRRKSGTILHCFHFTLNMKWRVIIESLQHYLTDACHLHRRVWNRINVNLWM